MIHVRVFVLYGIDRSSRSGFCLSYVRFPKTYLRHTRRYVRTKTCSFLFSRSASSQCFPLHSSCKFRGMAAGVVRFSRAICQLGYSERLTETPASSSIRCCNLRRARAACLVHRAVIPHIHHVSRGRCTVMYICIHPTTQWVYMAQNDIFCNSFC